jgi:fermentation-respiration switch protein FrsA (DUF1100 family)
MRRLMVNLLLIALAGVATLVLLWAAQRRLMYFPMGPVPPPASVGLTGAEPVAYPTTDGLELAGWFVARPGRSITVVVFNGNAGHRGYRAPLAAALAARGIQVLLTDYRGYGGNPGSPSERGLMEDARAARAYLLGRADVDASKLVYFGESLGTAVAVALAAEHPPAALILRSPFTSMADLGQHHYPFLPVRSFLQDRYAAAEAIRRLRAPLLVVAGARDRVVPIEYSRRLYEQAPEPKTLVVLPHADHNDYELLAGPDMIEAIVRFVEPLR